ncbi:MAG: hypothetical protein WC485_09040, partial [Opitutaceae bacterium]
GLALSFAALAALHRAAATEKRGWLAASLMLATGAVGLELASAWVLVALIAFAVALWPPRSRTAFPWRAFTLGLTAVGAAFAIWNAAAFCEVGLSWPTQSQPAHGANLLWALLSGTVGVLLNTFLPVQAGSLNAGGLIHFLEVAVLGLGCLGLVRAWRPLGQTDRRLLLAIATTLLVQVAMIAVARRPTLAGYYWPAKWTATAHSTFVILLALVVDRRLRRVSGPGDSRWRWATAGFLVGLWLAAATPALLAAMGAPVSRANNVRGAIARRADFARFHADVSRLAAALPQRPVVLPPCPDRRFSAVFPRLEGYSLSQIACALPANLLLIAPWPSSLPPPVRMIVAGIPDLQRLYFDDAS